MREFAEMIANSQERKLAENENRKPIRWIAAAPTQTPVDIADDSDFFATEGAASLRMHFQRERDRGIIDRKRRQVLAQSGLLVCCVCQFDFLKFYGPIAKDFCEVHHLSPLGDVVAEIETRLEDLAIVCANCHRILHRRRPPLSPDELRALIEIADGRRQPC